MRRAIVVLVFLAAACAQQQDADELTIARRHLRVVPCGAEPSIAGVAGVYPHDPRATYLGDWIIVSVCHLDALVKQAEAAQEPVTLYVNGRDFGCEPSGLDLESGQVVFILGRNQHNKELWHPLLYNPLFDKTISLHVSAGVHNDRPLPRAPGANTTLILTKLYADWKTAVLLALLLAIVIALIVYARRSDLLRDGPTLAGVRQPYSVARVQMAWWFFLILTAFSYIWMVTGEIDTITPALLALLGISAATAVAAVAISPTEARVSARGNLIDEEVAVIDKAVERVAVDAAAASPELQAVLTRRRAELERRRAALIVERSGLGAVAQSQSFWRDLVTDDRGAVALDRFQIVAWTVILGCVFLQSVVWDLSMPEFSTTTLALMGISSGTYIGFKIPQRRPET